MEIFELSFDLAVKINIHSIRGERMEVIFITCNPQLATRNLQPATRNTEPEPRNP